MALHVHVSPGEATPGLAPAGHQSSSSLLSSTPPFRSASYAILAISENLRSTHQRCTDAPRHARVSRHSAAPQDSGRSLHHPANQPAVGTMTSE